MDFSKLTYYKYLGYEVKKENPEWKYIRDNYLKGKDLGERITLYSLSKFFLENCFLDKIFPAACKDLNTFVENNKKANIDLKGYLFSPGQKLSLAIGHYVAEVDKPKSSWDFVANTLGKQFKTDLFTGDEISKQDFATVVETLFMAKYGKKPQDMSGARVKIILPVLKLDPSKGITEKTDNTSSVSKIDDSKIEPSAAAKTIYLVRGHSSANPGATYTVGKTKYHETDFIKNVVTHLEKAIKDQGLNVKIDPQKNYPKSSYGINARVKDINKLKDSLDLVVSLHFDSRGKDSSGTHIYYPYSASKNPGSYKAGKKVKEQLAADKFSGTDLRSDDKTAVGSCGILQKTKVYAILIELGNGKNKTDRDRFASTNETFMKKWSKSIAKGVKNAVS